MSNSRINHPEDSGTPEDDSVASYQPAQKSEIVHEIEFIEANGEYIQLNKPVMEPEEVEVMNDEDHWEHSSIKLLLDMYLQNIERFRNPKIRKKNVWVDIANSVGKGPDSCNKKFRNLKLTYIRLVKKKDRNGAASIKWPYFDLFEEIYNVDGQYHPDIQQKLHETSESVTKALLTINVPAFEPDYHENGPECSTQGQTEEVKRKLNRKRHAEYRKVALEMRDRQKTVEDKLDRLINIVEESNSIQRERNRLFVQFLEKLNQNL